jgi:hypothetical protein
MTVRALPPLVEYTGNGSITRFDWDWDMIDDSSIEVLVDNYIVTNWTLEGQSVVFDAAPADGAEIIIYRRTIVWMPEDYLAFGRFLADKTELSLDRATLIAQERYGSATGAEAPNGIVGGPDLHLSRQEFTTTVHSERGTDAVLPMYDADDEEPIPPTPDPSIIWAGEAIFAGIYSLPGNTEGVAATLRLLMTLEGGDPTHASAFFPGYNATGYRSWLDGLPADNEYWMRVFFKGHFQTTGEGGSQPTNPTHRFILSDGTSPRFFNEEFPIRAVAPTPAQVIVDRFGNILTDRADEFIFPRDAPPFEDGTYGPYLTVHSFGNTPPTTLIAWFDIDICKDNGSGQPDDAWVRRRVYLEAIFNA